MSNADATAPKQRVVGIPFKPGQSGNPAGRPMGSRNRLADAFVTDLRDCWALHGRDALERVARDEPATLLKVVASLLPRDIDINVNGTIDVGTFAARFRTAVELLGNTAPEVRKPLPSAAAQTIEHDNGS